MHKVAKHIIASYFIVVAIFFFGNNSALAAVRPYLPADRSPWPGNSGSLSNSVATIQAEQQADNVVQWVQHGSPHFSNPGVATPTLQATNIAQAKIFGGFQDIDIASSFEQFSNQQATVPAATNSKRRNMQQQKPTAQPNSSSYFTSHANDPQASEQLMVAATSKSAVNKSATTVVNNPKPELLTDNLTPQYINVWLDLDS